MSATTTDRPTTSARLPGALALGWERTRYELRVFVRERDAMVFIFAYPIIMMAIFASVFGQGEDSQVGLDVVPGGFSFATYFLPGMLATGALLSSFQTLATSIPVERDEGGLKRLRATPMPTAAYFLGKVGQVLAVSLVQAGLLLAMSALFFDVELPSDAGRWATLLWVYLLGTASGAICGVAFSSVPRSGKSASAVIVPIVLVLQFLSGVFFPFYSLPSWMQQIASVFPLKWMAQGMRSAILPDGAQTLELAGSWEHGRTALVLAAWLVAGLVVGVRYFRWQRRDDG